MNDQEYKYLNQVQLSGNVGKDLETKKGKEGGDYGIFSVAQNYKIKGADGEDKPMVRWFNIFVWNDAYTYWKDKVTQGSWAEISGRLSIDGEGRVFISINDPKSLKIQITGKVVNDEVSAEAVEQEVEQSATATAG